MDSDLLFPVKVAVFFALVFGTTLWLISGAPVPVRTVKPLEPSPDVPTFAEAAAEARERELANPRSPEAIELEHAMQQLTVGAILSRFKKCDATVRHALITGVGEYYRLKRQNPSLEIEPRKVESPAGTFMLDDKKVRSLIAQAFAEGRLTLREFSAQTRATLEEFVKPASEERQQKIKQCQGLG